MPFPTALRALSDNSSVVAWAWGINAFFTVIGTTLATFLAQWAGYRVVLAGSLACYLIALLVAKSVLDMSKKESPA